MGALLASLPTVTVALCDDGTPLVPGDMSLFSGAKQVAAQCASWPAGTALRWPCRNCCAGICATPTPPGLAAAAQLLAAGRCDPPPACPEIKLFAAPSREEEARAAAAAIRRLMRQGVRCGKVAVVCRDISKYRAAVKYEFRMADIPSTATSRRRPSSAPRHGGAVSAGHCPGCGADGTAHHPGQDRPLRLTEEEVCALENYAAYTWSPNAAAWRAPFEKNPGAWRWEPTDEDRENLARAEKARTLSSPPPTACAGSSALPTPSR